MEIKLSTSYMSEIYWYLNVGVVSIQATLAVLIYVKYFVLSTVFSCYSLLLDLPVDEYFYCFYFVFYHCQWKLWDRLQAPMHMLLLMSWRLFNVLVEEKSICKLENLYHWLKVQAVLCVFTFPILIFSISFCFNLFLIVFLKNF